MNDNTAAVLRAARSDSRTLQIAIDLAGADRLSVEAMRACAQQLTHAWSLQKVGRRLSIDLRITTGSSCRNHNGLHAFISPPYCAMAPSFRSAADVTTASPATIGMCMFSINGYDQCIKDALLPCLIYLLLRSWLSRFVNSAERAVPHTSNIAHLFADLTLPPLETIGTFR